MWLLLAFICVPLIEIALFIQVGGVIGLWPTLLIVVLTAILGTALVKSQGRAVMNDMRQSFSQLNDPSEPLAHGAMILFSGALLLTPGFLTDAMGFALLSPWVRRNVFEFAKSRIHVQKFDMGGSHQGAHPGQTPESDIIDGDFHEVDPPKKPTHPSSGWTKH